VKSYPEKTQHQKGWQSGSISNFSIGKENKIINPDN
jgi:hypothetical protein